VFDRLNANRLRVKLVLVGADLAIDAPWLEQRPWSLQTQHEDVADFDIGIMPLPDDEWARGKCGYKLLQYFAAGVPAVASPVGMNTDLVGGERGRLARSQADWHRALLELVGDASMRREMGINGRRFAQAHYSYERWAAPLAELVRSAVSESIDPRRPRVRPWMAAQRISVVVTVRNDRDDLQELLPALAAQRLKPDELVVVDGGSVDGTLDVLRSFSLSDVPIRVSVAPGTNIAAGRNVGIRLARNELIACTDAGCRPSADWLKSLRDGLDHADLVGGVCVADGQTEFEQILSLTHYPVPDELDRPGVFVRLSHQLFGRQYLASRGGGRSMAFHRDAWRAVGGFPEIQYAGEDQAFARAIVDNGFKATLARDAVVHWRPPGTWKANATMFFRYCRGDVRSRGRSRHILRLLAWSAGPMCLVRGKWRTRAVIIAGATAYVSLPVRRARLAQMRPNSWWRIPVAVAVKDLAQIAGAARGAFDALQGVPQPTPQPALKLPDVAIETANADLTRKS
jgi:GT2 family glycosyltransferase